MDMNERKLKILKIVIDDFINTAQPVGSRSIAKKYPLGISSATIRNEMADLEELGYLQQPHTSAGRIPSDLGYRLYVDSLMSLTGMGADESEVIRSLLLNRIIEVDDVIQQALELMVKLTEMTVIVSLPQFNKSKLTNMKLVKINDSKVLLILVADSGVVKSIPLGLKGATQDVLDVISDVFIHELRNLTIEDINMRRISALKFKLSQYNNVIDYLVPILRDTLNELDEVDLSIEGVNNILNYPEFNDMERAKEFIGSMKDENIVRDILALSNEEGISIKIGSETQISQLSDCSVVLASYKFNGKNEGKIAVVGPTRMDYGKIISVVDYVRETLSEIFTGIYL